MPRRVAIVGAGMAGLTAARILGEQGYDVVLVEKARGAGGRMATRRQGDYRFDHGAQYFTARDPRFLQQVQSWQESGLVASWQPRITVVGEGQPSGAGSQATERFVAVPGMSAICSDLAAELSECRFSWTVHSLARTASGWTLHSTEGETLQADVLLLSLPPEQARALLLDPEVDTTLASVEMRPCWAVMAVLDRPLLPDWDAAFINEGPLSWVANQAGKPGRPSVPAWVLHANPDWSSRFLEHEPNEVRDLLLDAARKLPIAQAFKVDFAVAHRWRYALARQPLERGALFFESKQLALAGDWCHGSRVEGAYLSGIAAAGQISSYMPIMYW